MYPYIFSCYWLSFTFGKRSKQFTLQIWPFRSKAMNPLINQAKQLIIRSAPS